MELSVILFLLGLRCQFGMGNPRKAGSSVSPSLHTLRILQTQHSKQTWAFFYPQIDKPHGQLETVCWTKFGT